MSATVIRDRQRTSTFLQTVFISPPNPAPAGLEIGAGTLADAIAYIDLVGDTTYSDFGLRLLRFAGANTGSEILHRGTGPFVINTPESAVIDLQVGSVSRLTLSANSANIAAGLLFTGVSSPAQITADQIDYAIAANTTVLRLSSDAPRTIKSIAGGTEGRYLITTNVGTQPIILSNQDALGTAANRFAFPNGSIVLFPNQSVTLLYDGSSSRWRLPDTQKQWLRKAIWAAPGNTTAITVQEATTWTLTGTATAAAFAASIFSQQRRIEYLVTVAATTAIAGWRLPQVNWYLGNAVNLGGFLYNCRWGNATGGATTTSRAFVGLANSTAAPTDVEPSTLVNMVGMGWDAADANIQIMTNDGTGVATKIDLGAGFPVPTTDRSGLYDLQFLALPNTASIFWKVVNVVTGAVASGLATTNIPAAATAMGPRGWISVGGTSSVIGITFCQCTIESDY